MKNLEQSPNNVTDYAVLLKDIKSLLQKGQSRAYQAVDNIKVQTYWQIGERIVREELAHKERADYSAQIVDTLARDLGFSRRLLFEMIQFYRVYPIVHTVCAQLSWSHDRIEFDLVKIHQGDHINHKILCILLYK